MPQPQRIVLVGSYAPDRQESMLRFTDGLAQAARAAGVPVDIWRPPVLCARWADATRGLGRWLGFIDKLVLGIPALALFRLTHPGRVWQVCDHSNAWYLTVLPWRRSCVTCHDLLGIDGAAGRIPGVRHHPLSALLQSWVARRLRRAHRVLAPSQATADALAGMGLAATSIVVLHNGYNAAFAPSEPASADAALERTGIPTDRPFLLHVGGNQWYKNRIGVVAAWAAWRRRHPDSAWRLVLAGKPWSRELTDAVAASGFAGDVLAAENLGHEALVAAYARAAALLFPSLAEGFGWPVAEAQACGGLVVTSDRAPLPEVGGDGAVYADPADPEALATALDRALADEAGLRRRALANADRFTPARWAEHHRRVWAELA